MAALGWGGLKNGILLQRMVSKGFTHLLTSDKNIRHQQNESLLFQKNISVIILAGPNLLQSHVNHIRLIRLAIKKNRPGFVEIKYGA